MTAFVYHFLPFRHPGELTRNDLISRGLNVARQHVNSTRTHILVFLADMHVENHVLGSDLGEARKRPLWAT